MSRKVFSSPLRHVEGQSEEHITKYGGGHTDHPIDPY